jgi:hypothetical protein
LAASSVDEVTITIPRDDAFHGVAELVLTGLASRRNATIEGLEDLRIALDALLGRREAGDELTVAVHLVDGELRTSVGPFAEAVKGDFAHETTMAMGIGRILDTVVDEWDLRESAGGHWIELTKRLGIGGAE